MSENTIGVEIDEIIRRKEAAERERTKIMESEREIIERIKNGATTEDPIKDFVLVGYGVDKFSKKVEGIYRDLENRIGKHIGEYVLMIVKSEVDDGPLTHYLASPFWGAMIESFLPPQRNITRVRVDFSLGVIKNGKLGLGVIGAPFNCEILVGKHVFLSSREEKAGIINDANLSVFWGTMGEENGKWQTHRCASSYFDIEVELKIGNEEIEAWLKKEGADILQRLSFEISPIEDGHLSFYKMAKLLDPNTDVLEKFPGLAKEIERRKTEVIARLNELYEERKKLIAAVGEGEGSRNRMVKPAHERLQDVVGKIKEQLRESLILDIADNAYPLVDNLREEYNMPRK